jgi:hypothetical protein
LTVPGSTAVRPAPSRRRKTGNQKFLQEVPKNACEDYPRLHGVQEPELCFQEEQEEQPRQNRNDEALQTLQQAYAAQGDQVSCPKAEIMPIRFDTAS